MAEKKLRKEHAVATGGVSVRGRPSSSTSGRGVPPAASPSCLPRCGSPILACVFVRRSIGGGAASSSNMMVEGRVGSGGASGG